MPFSTARTPVFVDAMLSHLDSKGRRYIDHQPHPGQADASQAQMTRWTVHQSVLHDLGRLFSTLDSILFGIALLARLLFLRLDHIRLDKGWWRRLLLLYFLDPLVGSVNCSFSA